MGVYYVYIKLLFTKIVINSEESRKTAKEPRDIMGVGWQFKNAVSHISDTPGSVGRKNQKSSGYKHLFRENLFDEPDRGNSKRKRSYSYNLQQQPPERDTDIETERERRRKEWEKDKEKREKEKQEREREREKWWKRWRKRDEARSRERGNIARLVEEARKKKR